jgi:hypothetical protein
LQEKQEIALASMHKYIPSLACIDQYRFEKIIPIALGKISHDTFCLDLGTIFAVFLF